MNGDICAENNCDFWDRDELECSKARRAKEEAKFYSLVNAQHESMKDAEKAANTETVAATDIFFPRTIH